MNRQPIRIDESSHDSLAHSLHADVVAKRSAEEDGEVRMQLEVGVCRDTISTAAVEGKR